MTSSRIPINSPAEATPSIRHVLYDFDGPKMVLALDDRGRQVLGIAVDEHEDGTTRWLFAPAAPAKIVRLLETNAGLRSFFECSVIEAHDIRPPWHSIASSSFAPDDVSDDLLPAKDAELPALMSHFRDDLIAEQRQLDQNVNVSHERNY